MKRVAALLLAVAMVGVSLLIRSRIDDTGPDGSSTRSGGGRPVVACVTELADACQRAYGAGADVRVEDASTTAAALVSGNATIDAWVTFEGWPELVGAKGGGPALHATAVASTPLVVAAVKERAAVLSCAAEGWSCFLPSVDKPWTDLGGNATWGALKVGLPPTTSAAGLLLEASAITGVAGTTDVGTNDDRYAQARALLARVDVDANAFSAFTVQFPARFSAVGALQVDVTNHAGTRADAIATFTLSPPATAIAVVARVAGSTRIDPARLTAPLRDDRWTVPPSSTTGLPDAGVLLALSGI